MSPKNTSAAPIPTGHRAQRLVPKALRAFLETEVAGGVALAVAIVLALIWANSPFSQSYTDVWHTEFSLHLGPWSLAMDLRHWVNDGLMVIFFFVVGLEIKRELAVGDLSDLRSALLPATAAIGGMVVPAAIYLAFNAGGPASTGWGVPMATDIALALGALALFGRGLPAQLRILLLSIAIVDDIGAVIVIAIFYSSGLNLVAVGAAVMLLGVVLFMRWMRVWWVPAYVAVGTAVWFAVHESGVHATIAGVALGLMAPAKPLSARQLRSSLFPQEEEVEQDDEEKNGRELTPKEARVTRFRVTASIPVTERLAYLLHPWSSFLILPIFALANAGIALSLGEVTAAFASSVTAGIVVGLIAGKIIGVTAFSWIAQRLGATLPPEVSWPQVLGLAALAGIGFTMSLFIATLAFEQKFISDAKVAILIASTGAAAIGAVVLRTVAARKTD